MADVNLRALSAPIEALREEVSAAYKRLDTTWSAIADELSRLPIPGTVSCLVRHDPEYEERTYLVWKKHSGVRRLGITTYFEPDETENTSFYDEWSGTQRADMLRHVPELFKEALKRTREFIDETKRIEVDMEGKQ
ncbi:MAG: hypothetical protein AAGB00_00030 [Planctomycetota bacterium]